MIFSTLFLYQSAFGAHPILCDLKKVETAIYSVVNDADSELSQEVLKIFDLRKVELKKSNKVVFYSKSKKKKVTVEVFPETKPGTGCPTYKAVLKK